jgi:hypothetical protein
MKEVEDGCQEAMFQISQLRNPSRCSTNFRTVELKDDSKKDERASLSCIHSIKQNDKKQQFDRVCRSTL